MLILGISCTKYCSIFEEVDLAKYSSNSVLLIIFCQQEASDGTILRLHGQ